MNCKQCKCKLTKRNKLGFPLLVKLTIELESCYVSDLRSEFDIVKNEIVFEIHALMAKVQLMKIGKQRCHFYSIPFFDNVCCQSLHCKKTLFFFHFGPHQMWLLKQEKCGQSVWMIEKLINFKTQNHSSVINLPLSSGHVIFSDRPPGNYLIIFPNTPKLGK